jgi:hypothetical protein
MSFPHVFSGNPLAGPCGCPIKAFGHDIFSDLHAAKFLLLRDYFARDKLSR